ncbi:hypothetical protein A3E33_00885 [Candidatus Nomurabacteria bacterium RIFCSPHIGHO2_12_FULL_40_77]|nr:MAG: hypothetical protein A3E33_00885 [Candidatus Nomurabacteria bacterium RIFCSPHIGHO2_12_FULL_40_77]
MYKIQQPVKQGFFDQFVLCVAYGIWRWRAETGRVNTNEEEMERRVDHHFAWMLVSREYYVPSYYQGSLRLARDRHVVTPESFSSTARHVALCISQARARFDWALAEYQLQNATVSEDKVQQRAAELYAARQEFSDSQNWELGKLCISYNHVISNVA